MSKYQIPPYYGHHSGTHATMHAQLWYKKPPTGITRIIGFILLIKVPDGAWSC